MELLTDPPVLLLDEPTSGLSSEDTLVVMKVLRRLADRGKAILLTIHQPGRDASGCSTAWPSWRATRREGTGPAGLRRAGLPRCDPVLQSDRP